MIDKIPPSYYPIRIRARLGRVSEADREQWKRMYEELEFTIADIAYLTGWTQACVQRNLYKAGTKTRSPKYYSEAYSALRKKHRIQRLQESRDFHLRHLQRIERLLQELQQSE